MLSSTTDLCRPDAHGTLLLVVTRTTSGHCHVFPGEQLTFSGEAVSRLSLGQAHLGVGLSCGLGPGLFHVRPILPGPAGSRGHILTVTAGQAQPHSTSPTFDHVTTANIPFEQNMSHDHAQH